jgi:hypothetical protein
MATFDSAWCLAEFDRMAGRPDADEITDVQKYARLAQAEKEVMEDLAPIVPMVEYKAAGPTAMSTSDSNVFTFGTDGQGHAQAPGGHVAVFRNLADYPDSPLTEGIDYLNEGTQIRIPNNRTESSLYWFGVPASTDISAAQEPTLRPAGARILIAIKAVKNFAEEGNHDPALADTMDRRYAQQFSKWCLWFRTQHRKDGGISLTGIERAIARQQF